MGLFTLLIDGTLIYRINLQCMTRIIKPTYVIIHEMKKLPVVFASSKLED